MKSKTETCWKAFPPYIDSYQNSPYDYDKKKCIPTTFNKFKKALMEYAYWYGSQSIGEQYLRESDVYSENGMIIMAIGWYSKSDNHCDKYALFVPMGWGYEKEKIIIKKFDYNEEWDIT